MSNPARSTSAKASPSHLHCGIARAADEKPDAVGAAVCHGEGEVDGETALQGSSITITRQAEATAEARLQAPRLHYDGHILTHCTAPTPDAHLVLAQGPQVTVGHAGAILKEDVVVP